MITKLIAILYAITTALERYQSRKVMERYQDEHEQLESDAADWYRNHFNGMSDNATEADKADSKRDTN